MQQATVDTTLTGEPLFLAPGYPWWDEWFTYLLDGAPDPLSGKRFEYLVEWAGDIATVQVWAADEGIRIENIGPDDLPVGTTETSGRIIVSRRSV
jgi:hypothetical protein